MLAFSLGAAAIALPLAGMLLHAGLDHVREVLDFTSPGAPATRSEMVGGAGKLALMREQLPLVASPLTVAAVLSAILLVLARARPAAAAVLAPAGRCPCLLAEQGDNLRPCGS